jgi:hypothetical protein
MYGTSERPLRTVYIDLADTTAVERTSEVHSAVVAIKPPTIQVRITYHIFG